MNALPFLILVLLVPSVQAGFDSYQTTTGARLTVAYPDVVNQGDQFFVTVNADAGTTNSISSFPTAPTGWTFTGCAFVGVDVNEGTAGFKGQVVRLNMTSDSCSFYVEVIWSSKATNAPNGMTSAAATVVTDDQDQNLFAKEFVQPIAWLVWLAYLVLLYKVKQTPLRAVAVLVGFSIVLIPMGQLQAGILLAGQLAVAVIFLVQLINEHR